MSAAKMILSPGITRWSHEILPHLNAALENVVLAGQKLNQAKADLPHGQFGPLLTELEISRQTANRFMRVANNPVIANRSPVGGLPASVSVLDVLTQLDDDVLEMAIADGIITASTTRSEAEGIAAAAKRSFEYSIETAARLADHLVALDDALDHRRSPLQARDSIRDIGRLVLVWAESIGVETIDQEIETTNVFEACEEIVNMPGLPATWVSSAFLGACFDADVRRRFSDQIAERHHDGDLVGALFDWGRSS